MWIDNEWRRPKQLGIQYEIYEQRTRGANLHGSYLVRLPEHYEKASDETYPVLFFLHGGMSDQSTGTFALEHYAQAQKEGHMPPTILISPQILPVGWYINSKDGGRKLEDIFVNDLIPHVHATYRTRKTRESVGIEGFSMGGYGALHLGLNNTELFGAISAIAPAIMPSIDDEPLERVADTFFGSQEYYEEQAPWTIAQKNGDQLRGRTLVRFLSGAEDTRLTGPIARIRAIFQSFNIPFEAHEVADSDHQYEKILTGTPDNTAFWARAFSRGSV